MGSRVAASALAVLVIVTMPSHAQAAEPPPGLAGDHWRRIREAKDAAESIDTTFAHEARLVGHGDPTGFPFHRFGYAVAIFGDSAVVGAPFSAIPGEGAAGSAHALVRSGSGWSYQQKLLAGDGASNDLFGSSVSIHGDTLVVGAPFANTPAGADAGSAYVFVRSGGVWTLQQKLTAADGAADDQFGASVAVEAETVLVGSPRDDTPAGGDAGSVYVFTRSGSTWSEEQKLLASAGAANDAFGIALSISGDAALIGAHGDDAPAGMDAGSAYVFLRAGSSWAEQQQLVASDAASGDAFGFSVSLSGDTVVVGAWRDGTPGDVDVGSAYIFVRSGAFWPEQQKLTASDGAAGDGFGYSVSASGDTVVVGAFADDTVAGTDTGSAYAFVRSGFLWSEEQKLVASDAGVGDALGFAVSASGDTIVAGAYLDNMPAAQDAGSTYVFVRKDTAWKEQQKLLESDAGGEQLGASVSISGDTAVVGAPGDHTSAGYGAGSVYVFTRSGTAWTPTAKLVAPDAVGSEMFGTSVSVSGDTLVVGAPLDWDTIGSFAGSAYVFVRAGASWILQQKLLASDAEPNDMFGSSVSISGDTVVAGAIIDDANRGSAYVFVRSGTTWSEQQKLVASDAAVGDDFGWSVSVSGDTVAVGALFAEDTFPVDAGAVYLFVRSGTTWTEQQKVLASDPGFDEGFGHVLAVSGDRLLVGAPRDDSPLINTGSVYVFERAGTVWSQRAKLVAPEGSPQDHFGSSVSQSGDTVVVGAPAEDVAGVPAAGAAHVFREQPLAADIGVTKTDGQASAVPGQLLTYVITVSNGATGFVNGVVVTDVLPAELSEVVWTCAASPGSQCRDSGFGDIDDVISLAAGGTATYTVTGTVASGATGALTNTVTVTTPAGVLDPDPANNSATDTDALTAVTDLTLIKRESADPVCPGAALTYELTLENAGPSDATSVMVADSLPSGVTFVSSSPGPPICSLGGVTLTCALASLGAGSQETVTINVVVNVPAGSTLDNNASVSGAEPDPDPGNNAASIATTVVCIGGELSHGTDTVRELAALPAPAPDQEIFRISQKPYSSFEVVVDGTSGDIGTGSGPSVERVAGDGTTVLQVAVPVGTGSSRSLRWRNTTATEINDQTIRVRSAGCGTDCGLDDVYRLRAYETTYSVPRFNNEGTQVTVLVLQNPANYVVTGTVFFQVPSGALVGSHSFALAPKAVMVLNTALVPGVSGVSGTITVAHDARYGDLAGKTVALEPSTGFSFDSALEPRPK